MPTPPPRCHSVSLYTPPKREHGLAPLWLLFACISPPSLSCALGLGRPATPRGVRGHRLFPRSALARFSASGRALHPPHGTPGHSAARPDREDLGGFSTGPCSSCSTVPVRPCPSGPKTTVVSSPTGPTSGWRWRWMVRSTLGNSHSSGGWRTQMPLAVSTRATKRARGWPPPRPGARETWRPTRWCGRAHCQRCGVRRGTGCRHPASTRSSARAGGPVWRDRRGLTAGDPPGVGTGEPPGASTQDRAGARGDVASTSSTVRPGRATATSMSKSSMATTPRMSKLRRPMARASARPSLAARSSTRRSMAWTTRPASGLMCCSASDQAPLVCGVGR